MVRTRDNHSSAGARTAIPVILHGHAPAQLPAPGRRVCLHPGRATAAKGFPQPRAGLCPGCPRPTALQAGCTAGSATGQRTINHLRRRTSEAGLRRGQGCPGRCPAEAGTRRRPGTQGRGGSCKHANGTGAGPVTPCGNLVQEALYSTERRQCHRKAACRSLAVSPSGEDSRRGNTVRTQTAQGSKLSRSL